MSTKILRVISIILMLLCLVLSMQGARRHQESVTLFDGEMLIGMQWISRDGFQLLESVEANDAETFMEVRLQLADHLGYYSLARSYVFQYSPLLNEKEYPERCMLTVDVMTLVLNHVPSNIAECNDDNIQWIKFKELIHMLSSHMNYPELSEVLKNIDQDDRTELLIQYVVDSYL